MRRDASVYCPSCLSARGSGGQPATALMVGLRRCHAPTLWKSHSRPGWAVSVAALGWGQAHPLPTERVTRFDPVPAHPVSARVPNDQAPPDRDVQPHLALGRHDPQNRRHESAPATARPMRVASLDPQRVLVLPVPHLFRQLPDHTSRPDHNPSHPRISANQSSRPRHRRRMRVVGLVGAVLKTMI